MPMPRSYFWLKEGETCRYCIGSGAALGGRCKHCGGLGKTFQGKARGACEECDGQGKIAKTGEPCGTCGGKGWEDFETRPTVACRYCMGSGNTVGGQCKHCGGAGRLELDDDGNAIDLQLTAAEREQKCPECLGIGYKARGASCDTCGGTGKKTLTARQWAAMKRAQAKAEGKVPSAAKPASVVPAAPAISQGNPLAQSKLGATKFCMGCGSGIPPGNEKCPKCGKPVNAPAPAAARIQGTPVPASSPAQAMFKPPHYCKKCGTAYKFEVTACPKCGLPAPPPTA
jgi:ribosomal protein L40E